MNSMGSYLLQMSCWLVAFWAIYVTVLKEETFFTFNRWFLNLGLLVSLLVPLLPIHYNVAMVAQSLDFSNPIVQVTDFEDKVHHSAINLWQYAYLVGGMFFMLRFLIQHSNLYRFRKKSKLLLIDSLKVYTIEKNTAPFSFFNKIYVSNHLSDSTELQTVVAHEKVHIRERHWIDLLLLEVVRTIQWFNPLMQFYRKAIMQNHEYLADTGTLQQGVSAHTYRAVLANQMLGFKAVSFANSFTFFNSTNRILMMNKDKSTPIKRFKILLILPLIALIMVGFAKPNYVINESPSTTQKTKTISVKGKVLDKDGTPLQGATVIVSNSTLGTITNKNGEFMIEDIRKEDVLVASCPGGYVPLALPARNKMLFSMSRSKIPIETGPGTFRDFDSNHLDPGGIVLLDKMKDVDRKEKTPDNSIEFSSNEKASEDEVIQIIQIMPEFPGGQNALSSYLTQEMSKTDETGKSEVYFIVNKDGSINNIKVVEGESENLNNLATKIITDMPKWMPGKQDGQAIMVEMQLGLLFGSGCYTTKYRYGK